LGEKATQVLIERDYAKKPLTSEEIETIFGSDPIPPFLNARHAVYKERKFGDQLPSRDELFELILLEPNLIRRPVTRGGGHVVIGFDKEALTKLAG
jgi:arsenate reductase-like glutaredoxin family protein